MQAVLDGAIFSILVGRQKTTKIKYRAYLSLKLLPCLLYILNYIYEMTHRVFIQKIQCHSDHEVIILKMSHN